MQGVATNIIQYNVTYATGVDSKLSKIGSKI